MADSSEIAPLRLRVVYVDTSLGENVAVTVHRATGITEPIDRAAILAVPTDHPEYGGFFLHIFGRAISEDHPEVFPALGISAPEIFEYTDRSGATLERWEILLLWASKGPLPGEDGDSPVAEVQINPHDRTAQVSLHNLRLPVRQEDTLMGWRLFKLIEYLPSAPLRGPAPAGELDKLSRLFRAVRTVDETGQVIQRESVAYQLCVSTSRLDQLCREAGVQNFRGLIAYMRGLKLVD